MVDPTAPPQEWRVITANTNNSRDVWLEIVLGGKMMHVFNFLPQDLKNEVILKRQWGHRKVWVKLGKKIVVVCKDCLMKRNQFITKWVPVSIEWDINFWCPPQFFMWMCKCIYAFVDFISKCVNMFWSLKEKVGLIASHNCIVICTLSTTIQI